MSYSYPIPANEPVLLTADRVSYDQELGIAIASGNVEITQGRQTLRADSVSVNEKQNKVAASGNVVFLPESGEVVSGQPFVDPPVIQSPAGQMQVGLTPQSTPVTISGKRVNARVYAASANGVTYPPAFMPPLQWQAREVRAEVIGARSIVLGPEPVIGPQSVVLSLEDRRLVIATDGLSPFDVVTDDASAQGGSANGGR